MENNESFASPKEETKKHCSTHCDWPNCTLEGCVTKPQVKKRYACRLDEQECLETCHGNRENKEKCSFCTVTETPASKEKPDFEKMAEQYYPKHSTTGIINGMDFAPLQRDSFVIGAEHMWNETRKQIAALEEEIRQLKNKNELYCDCKFVMIMRDQNTQRAYCSECKKEVIE